MESFVQNGWSFSITMGFLAFVFFASIYNHIKIRDVKDHTVAPLCLVISAIAGLMVMMFAKVLAGVFYPPPH